MESDQLKRCIHLMISFKILSLLSECEAPNLCKAPCKSAWILITFCFHVCKHSETRVFWSVVFICSKDLRGERVGINVAKINSVIVVHRPQYVVLPYLERNVTSSLTGQGCNDTLRYDYSPGSLKLGRNGLQDVDYSSDRTRSEHLSAVVFTTIPIVTNHSCLFWCFIITFICSFT